MVQSRAPADKLGNSRQTALLDVVQTQDLQGGQFLVQRQHEAMH
eukprot:CAMPEP_0115507162 /NCGR_PEP_ID=MMETSP0271-20121206/71571_1 /TAXON_ID=71861 /ORGANISM="Scrippsiella trochoidea, Strain CCMP3099" /LENGTH=43 /DNA_ID= /DNA_START= /DNA_END= /DNA_ORIENTATION=